MKHILPFVEGFQGRYFEPFMGGGAVFFALKPAAATLSDVNQELIECYKTVRDKPVELASALRSMPNDQESYYKVRASRPSTPLHRAARFLYLTSLSFNGIYRLNLNGEFNVPYGHKSTKTLPNLDELTRFSAILKRAKLLSADFQTSTEAAGSKDIVYFDPPYTVAHNNNGFVKYNASIFSWQDQRRLAEHASRLAARGCRVVVSNADHGSVRALYREFNCFTIERKSVIAANSAHRRSVTECLFVSS